MVIDRCSLEHAEYEAGLTVHADITQQGLCGLGRGWKGSVPIWTSFPLLLVSTWFDLELRDEYYLGENVVREKE